MFTILGATGNTGSVVAHTLLDRGKRVRVVVRDERKALALRERGAEIAVGSLHDPATIERALRDTEGAYLLLPPDPEAASLVQSRATTTDALVDVIARTKPGRVVFLSSVASHIFGERYTEQKLAGLGVTFLRASYFMSNWAAVLPAARGDGVLPTFIRPDRKIATVSTRDIGTYAAQLLLEPAPKESIVELTGPDEYSPGDVARVLTSLLGKPVEPLALPNDAVVPTFTQLGITSDFAELFRQLYAALEAEALPWLRPAALVRGKTTLEAELRGLVG